MKDDEIHSVEIGWSLLNRFIYLNLHVYYFSYYEAALQSKLISSISSVLYVSEILICW